MTTVLKNGRIFDGNNWGWAADILVEDGIITAVGSGFSGDKEYDLKGYTILPGLFDAHMHILTGDVPYSDFALKGWAQAGVTTLRDLGLGNPKPVEDFLAYRETVDNADCAQCITCGRFVTAYHGYCHIMPDGFENGIGIKTPEEGKAAVDRLIDMGCEGIKTAVDVSMMASDPTAVLDTPALTAIANEAKSRGVWCCVHVLDAKYLDSIIEAGIPELAHVPSNHISDETIDRLIENGVILTPTLCTLNAPRIPIEGEDMPPMPKMPDMPGMPKMPMPDMVSGEEKEAIAIDNTARFFKKGGMVVCGTDAMRMETRPSSVAVPVRELQLLYKAMGSVKEVIKSATINAAVACHLDRELGTIEAGKKANIIAIKDKLDESFDALSHVEFVMNKGQVIKNV